MCTSSALALTLSTGFLHTGKNLSLCFWIFAFYVVIRVPNFHNEAATSKPIYIQEMAGLIEPFLIGRDLIFIQ